MSETFVRPNGKAYKPRRAPSVVTYEDPHQCTALAVLRTHDIQQALELAGELIDYYDLNPTLASTDWWRLVPYDAHHLGVDSTWITDPARGVPCVVIPCE